MLAMMGLTRQVPKLAPDTIVENLDITPSVFPYDAPKHLNHTFELNLCAIPGRKYAKRILVDMFLNNHNPCYNFATASLNYTEQYRTGST